MRNTSKGYCQKFYSINLSAIATILFAATFMLIDRISAPVYMDRDAQHPDNKLDTDTSEEMLSKDLQFYSSTAIFIILLFVAMSFLMAAKNCSTFIRYGVM